MYLEVPDQERYHGGPTGDHLANIEASVVDL